MQITPRTASCPASPQRGAVIAPPPPERWHDPHTHPVEPDITPDTETLLPQARRKAAAPFPPLGAFGKPGQPREKTLQPRELQSAGLPGALSAGARQEATSPSPGIPAAARALEAGGHGPLCPVPTTHRARARSEPRRGFGGAPARPGDAGRRRPEAVSRGAQSTGRGGGADAAD